MRRLCSGLVVAAATVLVPTWTWAGNQEVAEQIAANLRESGQLQGYKIGVKVQDGTAWLKGRVSNPDQVNTALGLASRTPGVTRVVNNLTVPGQTASAPSDPQGTPIPASSKPEPATSVRPLQSTAGALAAERPSYRSPAFQVSPQQYAASGSRSAEQLRDAAVSALPCRGEAMAESSAAQRVPTAFATAPAQAASAMSVQASAPMARQPIPVAYLQAPTTSAMPSGDAPQPIPAGAPQPMPQMAGPVPTGAMPAARYDQPYLPNYSWPGYAAYPNYAGVTYPRQYSPMAWPYIGPFYPYPPGSSGLAKSNAPMA